VALDAEGNEVQGVNAFDIDLKQEMAKPAEKQVYPLYIAEYDGKKYYIIPLYGKGLWDDIWGYVSLKSDMNTIHGIKFDHKGETPGLGANITEKWFEQRFIGEKIFDQNGNFTGIDIVKNWKDETNKDDHKVDAISGATLTSNGVEDMINERLKHYVPYFKKQQKQ
jgi:Na+-transporting NADH:ubiquinone oxidoreductase subunit C